MLQVGSAVQEKPPQEEGEVGGEVGGLSRTELGRTELARRVPGWLTRAGVSEEKGWGL